MGIQKITFDGATVSAKVDADVYHFLFSHSVGILSGIKNNINYTLANNIITFLDGYVAVYGRLIYIENNTQISISPDSNKLGFVVLGVNTSTNEVSIYLKEQASSYPTLTQNNLVDGNGLYEFVLCAYSKTQTAVVLDRAYGRIFISSVDTRIEELKNKLRNDMSPKEFQATKISNGVYRITGVRSDMLMRSVIYIVVGSNRVVTLPGILMFQGVGSAFSISYEYASTTYSMYISYVGGNLTMTCSSTSHTVSKVIIFEH